MMHNALLKLFPGAKEGDWLLQDDGAGPYIRQWNRAEPQPTMEEIKAAAMLPVVPDSVTKRQARAALIIRGHEVGRDYIAEIESYLDAMTGVVGILARDEWCSSNAVERNRPLTIQMAQHLGLTDKQVDELFVLAATL